jgi:alpha-mannosidase
VGPYRVRPRHDGVCIEQRKWKRTLVDGAFPQVRFRLEDGDLWTEQFLGPMFTDAAGVQKLVRCEQGPVTVRFVWEGEVAGDPAADPTPPVWKSARDGKPIVFADLHRLAWEKEVVFYRESDRIDVNVRLDFRGKNTKVHVGFPLELDLSKARAVYDVPFAAVQRKPYFELPSDSPELEGAPLHLAGEGTGAWPALAWVAYGDDRWGLIAANQGTPSHRLAEGMIEVGVLRSPTSKSSGFTPPRQACENGRHEFRFALLPYKGQLRCAEANAFASAFNAPPLSRAAKVDAEPSPGGPWVELAARGVAFSALKKAERGEGYVLRTYETNGAAAKGKLATALELVRVQELDLMERPIRDADPKRLAWRPFEIKTLRLEFAR